MLEITNLTRLTIAKPHLYALYSIPEAFGRGGSVNKHTPEVKARTTGTLKTLSRLRCRNCARSTKLNAEATLMLAPPIPLQIRRDPRKSTGPVETR